MVLAAGIVGFILGVQFGFFVCRADADGRGEHEADRR